MSDCKQSKRRRVLNGCGATAKEFRQAGSLSDHSTDPTWKSTKNSDKLPACWKPLRRIKRLHCSNSPERLSTQRRRIRWAGLTNGGEPLGGNNEQAPALIIGVVGRLLSNDQQVSNPDGRDASATAVESTDDHVIRVRARNRSLIRLNRAPIRLNQPVNGAADRYLTAGRSLIEPPNRTLVFPPNPA